MERKRGGGGGGVSVLCTPEGRGENRSDSIGEYDVRPGLRASSQKKQRTLANQIVEKNAPHWPVEKEASTAIGKNQFT